MRLFILKTFVFSFAVLSGLTPAQANETKEVGLSVGFGFHLCGRNSEPPPLETAFLCPGLAPTLRNVVVQLRSEKTSKPEWKLWSGRVTDTLVSLNGIIFSYELLVSSADLDGKEYAFISGRITSSVSPTPAYFRVTAYGAFDALNGSHHFSQPIEIKAPTGELMDLSAVLAISKKY